MRIEFHTSLPGEYICERDKGSNVLRIAYDEWAKLGKETRKSLLTREERLLKHEQMAEDKARMSVPVVDLPAQKPSDARGLPLSHPAQPSPAKEAERKDHIIRAWDEDAQQVVYWQDSWGWRPARRTAQRFTRMRALDLANSTNAMDDTGTIINVCAIKEID